MADLHGGRVVAKALKAEGVPYIFTLVRWARHAHLRRVR